MLRKKISSMYTSLFTISFGGVFACALLFVIYPILKMSIALHVPLTAGWHSKPLKTSLQQTGFLCQLLVICCFKYIWLISKTIDQQLWNNQWYTVVFILRISADFPFLGIFVFLFFSWGVAQDSRETCAFFGGMLRRFLNSPQHYQLRRFSIKQLFSEAARHQLHHVSENGSMNSELSSVCSHLYLLICLFLSFFENVCTPDIWRCIWDDLSVLLVSLLLFKCAHAGILLCVVGLFSRVSD